MNDPIYCGIDVAKRNFVIGFSHQKKTKTETNNAKGIQHTLDYLSRFNVALITLEATGGLEIPVAKALARAGYRVFIANSLKASEFAKSQTRAKTDAKDEVNLAFYGLTCELKGEVEHQLYVPLSEQEEQLEALVVRRRQLVDMRVAELNRLQQSHETQLDNIQQHIEMLDKLIAEKGKAKKVAIMACMRKLLTIMNALVRRNEKWDATRYLSHRGCELKLNNFFVCEHSCYRMHIITFSDKIIKRDGVALHKLFSGNIFVP